MRPSTTRGPQGEHSPRVRSQLAHGGTPEGARTTSASFSTVRLSLDPVRAIPSRTGLTPYLAQDAGSAPLVSCLPPHTYRGGRPTLHRSTSPEPLPAPFPSFEFLPWIEPSPVPQGPFPTSPKSVESASLRRGSSRICGTCSRTLSGGGRACEVIHPLRIDSVNRELLADADAISTRGADRPVPGAPLRHEVVRHDRTPFASTGFSRQCSSVCTCPRRTNFATLDPNSSYVKELLRRTT